MFPKNLEHPTVQSPLGFATSLRQGGFRSLKPARPLKQEFGYSDQVVVKARVWI